MPPWSAGRPNNPGIISPPAGGRAVVYALSRSRVVMRSGPLFVFKCHFVFFAEFALFSCDSLSGDDGREKLAILSSADGPRDAWRTIGDSAAAAGNTMGILGCIDAGASGNYLRPWFQGILLGRTGAPPRVVLGDCPSCVPSRI